MGLFGKRSAGTGMDAEPGRLPQVAIERDFWARASDRQVLAVANGPGSTEHTRACLELAHLSSAAITVTAAAIALRRGLTVPAAGLAKIDEG